MPQAAKESEAAEAARVKMAAAMAHDNNTAAEMAQLREEVLQLTGAEIETLQVRRATFWPEDLREIRLGIRKIESRFLGLTDG